MQRSKGSKLAPLGLVVALCALNTAGHASDQKDHNFPANAFEYAKLIKPILGVPPKIDLGEGVEIPLYVDGVKDIGTLMAVKRTYSGPCR